MDFHSRHARKSFSFFFFFFFFFFLFVCVCVFSDTVSTFCCFHADPDIVVYIYIYKSLIILDILVIDMAIELFPDVTMRSDFCPQLRLAPSIVLSTEKRRIDLLFCRRASSIRSGSSGITATKGLVIQQGRKILLQRADGLGLGQTAPDALEKWDTVPLART
ncbi:hypothetical protein VTN96DRAFT_1923 [Rasamsonia emersonii]